jgi:hypothetical protein
METPSMPVEMLTYSALGERPIAGKVAAAVTATGKRRQNPVVVDVTELAHKPMPARSPAGDHPITARVEALQVELARSKPSAAGSPGGLRA